MSNPLETIVRDFPTPEILDGLLVERWDVNKGSYSPLPVGTRIPEGFDSAYAGYELVHQKTSGDFRFVDRFWCNPAVNQDIYNAEEDNDAQDATKPIFTRRYVERRPIVERTMGTALKAVIGAVVTASGSGYGVAPTVAFSGGGGTGAAAQAIIYRGVVVYLRITAEGSGYTSAPAITITAVAGDAGSGATGTATIQPATAVLTVEKVDKLPAEDPRFGLYDVVTRIYTTLPGATLIEPHYDEKTNTVITTAKTRKLTSAITPGAEDIAVGSDHFVQITSAEPIDALTSYEVVVLQPQPVAHDLASAFVTKVDYVPFEFPATLDVALYQSTNGVLGYNPAFGRRVQQVTSTYWVVATSAPDVSAIMADAATGGILKLGSIFGLIRSGGNLGLGTLSEIVYDAVNLTYGTTVIDWPGSVPDFTTYKADWVGTDAMPAGDRFWRAEVNPEGSYFKWRVDLTQVQYLLPAQGTIEP